MPCGIVEPKGTQVYDIPGTCFFEDVEGTSEDGQALKRHPTNPMIILRPQPSDDVLDPLNWGRWKKEAYFVSLLYMTSLAGVIGPLFIPAFNVLAAEFDRPVSDISKLNGTITLALGVSSFLSVALANVWGRRPIYVLSVLLFFGGCIWGAVAKDYQGLYGARWIQGLGMGAFACMGNAAVTDMFYLHEAGLRIGLWQLSQVVSVNVAPVISGQIISAIGWRGSFWVLAGCTGPAIFTVLAFMPESCYSRTESPVGGASSIEEKDPAHVAVQEASTTAPVGRWQQYKIFNGRISHENLVRILTTPFVVLFTPSIFWVAISYGFFFSTNIVMGTTYAQIFTTPPYNVSLVAIGNLAGVPPLIGSLAACLLSAPFSDWCAKVMSKRNHGIFEAEFRLPLMLPAGVFSLIGMLVYGFGAQNADRVIVPAVGIAFTQFGLTCGFIGTIVYSAAVFPARGGETFGIIMLYKSCFAFGATYYCNNWVTVEGPGEFMGVICAITVGLCLTSIPIYFFGKRLRVFASESLLLGWTTR